MWGIKFAILLHRGDIDIPFTCVCQNMPDMRRFFHKHRMYIVSLQCESFYGLLFFGDSGNNFFLLHSEDIFVIFLSLM